MRTTWKIEKELGRTAEEGSGEKSDTEFGRLILAEAKKIYGDDFDFIRCMIEQSSEGFVVTFMQDKHAEYPLSRIRMSEILPSEDEEVRSVIKMVLFGEFRGIGEELIDNIEEDILNALKMTKSIVT